MSYPAALTEEEQHLKKMYEWLRKIKSAIKMEEAGKNQPAPGKIDEKRRSTVKSISEQEDAKEMAKRLIKSGAVTVQKQAEKQSFKRSKLLDKKLKESEGSTGPRFQAYNEAMLGDYASPIEDMGMGFSSPKEPKRSLYSNFVPGGLAKPSVPLPSSSKDSDGWGGETVSEGGNVILVRGFDFMDDPLRLAFEPYGPLLSLNIDDRRRSAQIEFADPAQAAKAVREMNGNMANGVTLRVSMARKGVAKPTTAHPWANPPPPKAPKKDDARTLVTYDEDSPF